MRWIIRLISIVGIVAGAWSCSDSSSPAAPTVTPRPVPSSVELPAEPAGNYTLVNAEFDPLPGAHAESGRLGGTDYRLEVPDNWNHRLVLYMHGSHDNTDELFVEDPPIRDHLIREGFAWAASSYSANADRTSNHARDTAALWDFSVQRLGRPEASYIMGKSIGGRGAVLSAIEFGDRYDGALAVCANASSTADYDYRASGVFVAGAFIAGVTQGEFEGADIDRLIEDRIKPALRDPEARRRFEDIVIDLSGGERPFAREGLRLDFDQVLGYASGSVKAGLMNNADRRYTLSDKSGIATDDFNARVVRNHDFNTFLDGLLGDADKYSGDLQIPLLTLHTTGDAANPLYWERVLNDSVAAAHKGDLLVQRAVRAAGHCMQTDSEWEAAFDALVGWAEHDEKPDGEDLTGSLADAGKFTLVTRPDRAPETDVVQWLSAFCDGDRKLAKGEEAIPISDQDPATLTLLDRRARAAVRWGAEVALNEEYIAAFDRLTPPSRVQALHEAIRKAHATTSTELQRSIAQADSIFTSTEAVEKNNSLLQAADQASGKAINDLFRSDEPLVELYRALPQCQSNP